MSLTMQDSMNLYVTEFQSSKYENYLNKRMSQIKMMKM